MLKRFNKLFALSCYLTLMASVCMPYAIAQQDTAIPLLVPMEEDTLPATDEPVEKVADEQPAIIEKPPEDQPAEPLITPDPLAFVSAPVSLTSIPNDIILLLDNSGSMKKNDPEFLTSKAVTEFISNLDYSTRLGIVIFDHKVKLAFPLTEVSEQSRAEMLESLKQINYRGLYTNSPDALERALYELKLHARQDTEKFVIFLTDGIVDTGNKQKDLTKADWMRNELAADAREHGIRIFGIAFTEDADFQLIQSLAQQTEAEYFRAFTANDIAPTFTRIQESIEQARRKIAEAVAEAEAQKIAPAPVQPAAPPAPPPEPIIVTVPEPVAEEDPLTKYMLYGILILLVLVLAAVLLRSRGGAATAVEKAAAMPNAQLIDIQRVTGRKDYALNTPITQIGRVKGKESPDVDHIVIEESRVSRHHAVIEYKNHGFWVMDQGSGNGTFLNGERLTEERHLKHNDILSFDKFEFMYFEPDMEQSDATVVQGAAPADRISRPFDEDETALQGPEEVETPPPPPPQVPDTHTADLVEDIESWDFGDTEEGDEEESQAHTIVPESLNDEEVEIEEDTGEKLPPETAAEEPAKIEESAQKEVLIEKKDGTFQPAKTMTPKEFERLFSEIDKDKK